MRSRTTQRGYSLKSLRAAYLIDDKSYNGSSPYNYFDENRKDKYWIINTLNGEMRGPFLWNSSVLRMAGCYSCVLSRIFSFVDNFKTCIYEDGTNIILDTLGNILLDKNTFKNRYTSQVKQFYSQTMNDSMFINKNTRVIIPKLEIPLTMEWYYPSGNQKVKIYTQLGEYTGYEGNAAELKYIEPDSTFLCFISIDDSIGLILNQEGKSMLKPNQWIITKHYSHSTFHYFGVRERRKEGVIDYKGNYVLSINNQEIIEVNDNYFVVKKNNKFYIYDNKGNLKSKEGYDIIEDSYYGGKPRRVFRNIPDKTYLYKPSCCEADSDTLILMHYFNVGCIDSLGNELIPLIYNGVSLIEKEYICLSKGFEDGKKEGFILDHKGNILLQATYDYMSPSGRGNTYFIVEKNNKNGLIDLKGNVILPLKYDRLYEGNNNIYYATEKNKTIYINHKGIILADESEISPTNPSGSQIGENYLLPLKNKALLINKQGEIVFTFKSDKVEYLGNSSFYTHGNYNLLQIKQKDKIWYYDYVLNKAYKEIDFEP